MYRIKTLTTVHLMRHHIELRMMLRAIRRMLFEGCTSCFANVLYANGNQYDLSQFSEVAIVHAFQMSRADLFRVAGLTT